ncbi:MAG: DUF2784 domain-containing protein [Gemmatimonadetes bacterium]|nr:DUF2784 domain-containing protein [Gemmatimonadota bacterium]NNM04079.1 DUF2784 domain-containing protein [Gemmatimonadota bacterium]
MAYRLFADLLVAVHLAFVLFVVFGGGLAFWRRWMPFVHLPAAIWGVYIELSGRVCPLTPLEVHFRERGGQAGYAGGFVDHYLIPLLYPPGLTRDMQVQLGFAVALLNLLLYGALLWRIRRSKGQGLGGES